MKLRVIVGLFLLIFAIVTVVFSRQYSTGVPLSDQSVSRSMRVGTCVWPGYEPFYLARSLSALDDRSIRLVEFSSASQVIRAFRNNTIEVAALTLDEVLLLKENGFDVTVILVTDVSHGGDVILAKPGIDRLSDLCQHRIGVEHTALGAFVLTRALENAGMSTSDVEMIPLEVNEHERAFDEGDIDAVVTFDPVSSRLIEKGAVRLFDSTQIPGEIVDVLVVKTSFIETDRSRLLALLRGWFTALEYLDEHPTDASYRMAGRLRLEPSEVLASFHGLHIPDLSENVDLMRGPEMPLVATARRLANWMKEQNLLKHEIDVSNLFYPELLKQLCER